MHFYHINKKRMLIVKKKKKENKHSYYTILLINCFYFLYDSSWDFSNYELLISFLFQK